MRNAGFFRILPKILVNLKLRTVLIDDEENALYLLKEYLKSFEKDIDVVGTATNSREAFKIIRQEKPDLVFFRYINARREWRRFIG